MYMYISTCTGTCTCLKINALGLETFFLLFATNKEAMKELVCSLLNHTFIEAIHVEN
jgi:hypothetical protein